MTTPTPTAHEALLACAYAQEHVEAHASECLRQARLSLENAPPSIRRALGLEKGEAVPGRVARPCFVDAPAEPYQFANREGRAAEGSCRQFNELRVYTLQVEAERDAAERDAQVLREAAVANAMAFGEILAVAGDTLCWARLHAVVDGPYPAAKAPETVRSVHTLAEEYRSTRETERSLRETIRTLESRATKAEARVRELEAQAVGLDSRWSFDDRALLHSGRLIKKWTELGQASHAFKESGWVQACYGEAERAALERTRPLRCTEILSSERCQKFSGHGGPHVAQLAELTALWPATPASEATP